jgi:hypothetical protein
VVLSVLWRVWPDFPANVVLFQLFDALALGSAAWIIAVHGRRSRLAGPALALALVAGFTAFPLLTIVGVRFSEPLFLLLFASAVSLADRERLGARGAMAAGLLAGLAMLTRSIGLAALIGIPISLWLRGGRKSASLAAAAGVLVIVPWIVWLSIHGGDIDPRIAANYGTYGQFAGQAGLRGMLTGLDLGALAPIQRLLLPGGPWVLNAVLTLGLAAVLVLGAVTLVPRLPALLSSLVPYLVIVTVWPYTPDRFVWILLPWIAVVGATGAARAWRWGWHARLVPIVIGIAVLVWYVPREVRSLAGRGFALTAERTSMPFRLLTTAIVSGTPDDAVVATDGEALVHLYTGRHTVPLDLYTVDGRDFESSGPRVTAAYFCEHGVSHVAASVSGSGVRHILEPLGAVRESTLVELFRVTDGPQLSQFRCPN